MTPPLAPERHGTAHPAGACQQPVLIRGRIDRIHGNTGELLHRYTTATEPGGVLPVACKTRRASRCLPCAQTYHYDTYQLIRAGLSGGKGIPATVADHPAIFLTLTAPSFGAVHTRHERHGQLAACRPGATARPARTVGPGPVRTVTTVMTRDSGSRSAPTATTTPGRSCSTPSLPSCGDGSPSPCAAPWPAWPG